MKDGVLLLDKPKGPTSHDVVGQVRRALRRRDVGHAGTLDPMATGALVVLLGEATKLSAYLTGADKSYEATIALGATTASLDADGPITETAPVPAETLAALAAFPALEGPLADALAAERARTAQIPPAVSAIHVDGVRAYDRARRGEELTLPPRPVHVRALTPLAATPSPPTLAVAVTASKGYYVRSLGRDLAAALGTVGHLTALRRVAAGPFVVAEAVAPDAPREALETAIVPFAEVVARAFPCLAVDAPTALAVRQGKRFAVDGLAVTGDAPFAVLEAGWPVALATRGEDGLGRVLRGFTPRAQPPE